MIFARTRHRYKRDTRTAPAADLSHLPDNGCPADKADVEAEVIHRFDLALAANAVEAGVVPPSDWRLLSAVGLGEFDGPGDPRDRQAISRARRRLVNWHREVEAA